MGEVSESCAVRSSEVPDYDMNGDEGDGDCVMEVTMQFDDAEVDRKNAVERVMNRNKADGVKRFLGGLLGF